MAVGEFQNTTINEVSEEIRLAGLQEGDKIVEINDKKIRRVSDINDVLENCKGENLNISVIRNKELVENINIVPESKKSKLIGIMFKNDGENYINEINYVQENSPAYNAGIQAGDKVIRINNVEVNTPSEIINEISNEDSLEKNIVILRKNEEIEFNVVPEESFLYTIDIDLKMTNNFFEKAYYSLFSVGDFIYSAIDSVKMIFTGKVKVEQLTGPIGIGKVVSETKAFEEFVEILVLISLSLGVTNLLPFPPLDGGKIVLIIIEAIRKKPLKENVEIAIQMAGFVIMIGLSIYVGYKDVLRII